MRTRLAKARQGILEIVVRILGSLSVRVPRLPQLLEDKGSESAEFVLHRGCRLPPKSMRNAMCGDAFPFDSFFFMSAVLEATRLSARLGYTKSSRIVDIGCGLGRLATGMLTEFGDVQYLGIDVKEVFVRWCRENIERYHPSFQFVTSTWPMSYTTRRALWMEANCGCRWTTPRWTSCIYAPYLQIWCPSTSKRI